MNMRLFNITYEPLYYTYIPADQSFNILSHEPLYYTYIPADQSFNILSQEPLQNWKKKYPIITGSIFITE